MTEVVSLITELLLGNGVSLQKRLGSGWKDIARQVGAPLDEYDTLRHTAKWLQETLPGMYANGQI